MALTFDQFFERLEEAGGEALRRGFEKLEPRLLGALRRQTPSKSGEASRAWRARIERPALSRRNDDLDLIFENPTEYISFLDEGSSSQAPRGITGPVLGLADRRDVAPVIDQALQGEFRRIDRA